MRKNTQTPRAETVVGFPLVAVFLARSYGGDGGRRQRAQRLRGWDEDRAPSRRKFDVGSFLRDGAQNIMQPAAGMEAKAAE